PGLTIEAAADRIRAQGGLVYAPHPFAYLTKADWRAHRVAAVADLVEVFNSRAFMPAWNQKAVELANSFKLPAAASSDAHFPWELGRAYTEVPEFSTAADLSDSLESAQPCGVSTGSAWLHVASALIAKSRGMRRTASNHSVRLSTSTD
ncbi:MAG: PHP domain-containing protein, partial [Gemmatimonadota bacterium]